MVIVITRRCTRCERERLRPDEIAISGPRVCHECGRRARSERQTRWHREHPESRRAADQRWQERNPDRRREVTSAYYQRLRADPERWEQHLQDVRINYRLRRERAGLPLRGPVSEDRYLHRYGFGWRNAERVDVAPLRVLLAEIEPLVVAELAGVDGSFVYRILRGYYDEKGIAVRDADRICVGLDVPLELLYAGDS